MAYIYYGYRPYNEIPSRKVTVALGNPFYKSATAEAKQHPGRFAPTVNNDVNTLTLLLRPHVLPPAITYPSYSNVIIDLQSLLKFREDLSASQALKEAQKEE